MNMGTSEEKKRRRTESVGVMVTWQEFIATSDEVDDFFSFYHAIIHCGFGPETRLVLMVLASHTNSLGETHPQTNEALAKQTGLELSVIEWVMDLARTYGWIVDDPKYPDEYTLTLGMFRVVKP